MNTNGASMNIAETRVVVATHSEKGYSELVKCTEFDVRLHGLKLQISC